MAARLCHAHRYLENAAGHHWLARRVPADTYFVSANQGRFGVSSPKHLRNEFGGRSFHFEGQICTCGHGCGWGVQQPGRKQGSDSIGQQPVCCDSDATACRCRQST